MPKEKSLQQHFLDRSGPYDLRGGSATPISEALAELSANTAKLDRVNEELGRVVGEESSPEPKSTAELSDEDFYARYQAALAGEQPAKASGSADLSEGAGEDESAAALLAWYREELDGTAARRRGLQSTKDARAEYLDYWKRQHAEGRPVPRDLVDEIEGAR